LTITATAAAERTATAEHEARVIRSATERNRELEAEVLALRQELAAWKQRSKPEPSANGAANCPEDLRAELSRLTAAVEVLQRRSLVDLPAQQGPAPTAFADPVSHAVSPLAVFLGATGIFVGWFLGSRYARRLERSRRSRLRF
jgi:hypothetical protein